MRKQINIFTIAAAVLALLAGTGAGWQTTPQKGTIVFSAAVSGNWSLWAVEENGEAPTPVTDAAGDEKSPAVSGRQEIAYIDSQRRVALLDPAAGKTSVLHLPRGNYGHPTWGPSGDLLAFVRYDAVPEERGRILLCRRRDGSWSEPETVAGQDTLSHFPAFSPDGRFVAFTEMLRPDRYRVWEELALLDLETRTVRRLTEDRVDSYGPAWSPDGKQIAYTSNLAGNYDVWVLMLKGGRRIRITDSDSFDGEVDWSPDGSRIVFVSTRSGSRELWIADVADRTSSRLTDLKASVMAPCWVK